MEVMGKIRASSTLPIIIVSAKDKSRILEDMQKAAYLFLDKMCLSNFEIMDDSKIRIYEVLASTQNISRNFLKLTGEEENHVKVD